jgi:hypothetical protein
MGGDVAGINLQGTPSVILMSDKDQGKLLQGN